MTRNRITHTISNRHAPRICVIIALLLCPSCLKSSYRESVCQLEIEFQYAFPDGVDAVDGLVTLEDYNTRREYKTSVRGTATTRVVVTRGFYSIRFNGIARSNGRLARVVALVEEHPAVGEHSRVTLKILSQWV